MVKVIILVIACLACSTLGYPAHYSSFPFTFVSRAAWGAKAPQSVTSLKAPVPYVVIHHTYIPAVCVTRVQCEVDMRSMQRTHMGTNGWVDIGYNFAVGGEGSVYEGRSWEAVGAHSVGYNSQSIAKLPIARQLQTTKELIAVGVQLGFIRPDYKLIAHRQAAATECPGDALYSEITTWDHFTPI